MELPTASPPAPRTRRTGGATGQASLGRGVDVLGDLWNLLIVRSALLGSDRFLELKRHLGISDPVLARRLTDLVREDILSSEPYAGARGTYRLTAAGRDLWPVFIAVQVWDNRWAADAPLRLHGNLRHVTCGHLTAPVFGCGACGAIGLGARDTAADLGSASGLRTAARRFHGSGILDGDHGQPVAAAGLLADRIAISVLAAAFLGRHRFGEFQAVLDNTAPQTLTSRLGLLVDQWLLTKEPVRAGGRREGYRLTPKGHDVFPAFVFLLDWSQRWSGDVGPPAVRVRHRTCGATLRPRWTCNACNGELGSQECMFEDVGCPGQRTAAQRQGEHPGRPGEQ